MTSQLNMLLVERSVSLGHVLVPPFSLCFLAVLWKTSHCHPLLLCHFSYSNNFLKRWIKLNISSSNCRCWEFCPAMGMLTNIKWLDQNQDVSMIMFPLKKLCWIASCLFLASSCGLWLLVFLGLQAHALGLGLCCHESHPLCLCLHIASSSFINTSH